MSYRERVARNVARKRRLVAEDGRTCVACGGTGTIWRRGVPRSFQWYGDAARLQRRLADRHAHGPLTVQETKRAQVRYPGEGRLQGSSPNWERLKETCQRPIRCRWCDGTGEVSAERLIELAGATASKKPVAAEKALALLMQDDPEPT